MAKQDHLFGTDLYRELEHINSRPKPFSYYTAADLWADEHTSKKMLEFHLDSSIDASSRSVDFINRSVEWMRSRFDLSPAKRIIDFGCGPGLYTSRLAALGAEVSGMDFSENSIQYAQSMAQQSGASVEYIQGNYLEFESEKRFDLITMIMCDYCALSPDQRKNMLCRFRKHLKPGGAVLFDVYSLTTFAAKEEMSTFTHNPLGGFWSAEAYFEFMNAFKYNKDGVMLDKYTVVEASRVRVIYNWLQCFDPEALKTEIEGIGLVVEEVLKDVAGGEYDPSATEFAVIARNRGGG